VLRHCAMCPNTRSTRRARFLLPGARFVSSLAYSVARSLCVRARSKECAQMSPEAPTRRAQPSIPRECPARPHTPSLHPYLGTFQPAFGPRALPLHVPLHPRRRASNFCSHTSTNPMRVRGGFDALPSVSRLSPPITRRSPSPYHRSKHAPKG
jgi:hypothetical protein